MAFPWDLAASAALPLLGGLFGDQWVGDTDSSSGIDTMDDAIAYLEDLAKQVPEISDQIVYWTDLIQQGKILPQDVIKIPEVQMAESKLRDFTPSTEAYGDATDAGLAELRKIAESGFSITDQASIDEIRRRVSTQERGQREAILQGAQQRGVGGSGLEMQSSLMAQQSAADRNALENLMTAARGEERRIGASGQAAQLGAGLRGQEFGESKAMDDADRLINQFNAQMRMRKGESDAQRMERAQYQNLSESQRIADINAQKRYEAALRNAGLQQQQFQNKLGVGQALASASGGKAGAQSGSMERKYRLLGGGIGGAGQVLGGYYGGQNRSSYDDYAAYQDFLRKQKQKQGDV